jgi:hypothetical protein
MGLPFDVQREVVRLVQLEILQEQENRLRFSSPLHAMWFEAKRQKGVDIHSGPLGEQAEDSRRPTLVPCHTSYDG